VLNEIAGLRQLASLPDHGVSKILNNDNLDSPHSPPIVVPAGSVDALQAAIIAAGNNGKVILRSGLHTENSTVTVTTRGVRIVGENGAILKSAVTHSNAVPIVIRPAIHVLGAERVTIWNVDFLPTGTVGGTAILLENSPRTRIGCNSFHEFQFSIMMQNAHSSTISGNTIVTTLGWQSGDPGDAEGIVNVNGNHVRIVDNNVSNGLIGVFASGGNGYLLHSNMDGNFAGLVACKVPAGSFQLPGGAVIGSDVSGHDWFVEGNNATGNLHAGYLIIDGANHNRLINNAASNNTDFDIELAGETYLFGFCTPTCFENRVVAGRHRNILINDFGLNNTVRGGNLVHVPIVPCP
jgi:hypothetical protein